MAAGNLTRRLAFSVVAIPAAVGIAYLGGWYFAGLIALVAVLGVRELYDFAAAQGIDPLRRIGMFGAAAIPLGTVVWVRAPYAYGWPQSLLYSGALSTGLAYILWNASVQSVGPSRTSAFTNLVPLAASGTAWAWLGERPDGAQLAGGALILLGIASWRTRR